VFNHILNLSWLREIVAVCFAHSSPDILTFFPYNKTDLFLSLTRDFSRLRYSQTPRLDFIALILIAVENVGCREMLRIVYCFSGNNLSTDTWLSFHLILVLPVETNSKINLNYVTNPGR
jgi:hypothetical protein